VKDFTVKWADSPLSAEGMGGEPKATAIAAVVKQFFSNAHIEKAYGIKAALAVRGREGTDYLALRTEDMWYFAPLPDPPKDDSRAAVDEVFGAIDDLIERAKEGP
jgi:hypothetical protein